MKIKIGGKKRFFENLKLYVVMEIDLILLRWRLKFKNVEIISNWIHCMPASVGHRSHPNITFAWWNLHSKVALEISKGNKPFIFTYFWGTAFSKIDIYIAIFYCKKNSHRQLVEFLCNYNQYDQELWS